MVTSLAAVFNIVGAIASSAISFIVPFWFYFSLVKRNNKPKTIHYFLSLTGVIIFIPLGILSIVSLYVWSFYIVLFALTSLYFLKIRKRLWAQISRKIKDKIIKNHLFSLKNEKKNSSIAPSFIRNHLMWKDKISLKPLKIILWSMIIWLWNLFVCIFIL